MSRPLDRRTVLRAAAAASLLAVVDACGGKPAAQTPSTRPSSIPPDSAAAPTTTTAAPTIPTATITTATITTVATPSTAATTVRSATVAPTTVAPTSSTTPRVAGAPAAYVAHGGTNSDAVALTFHLGGDPALVTQLLDLMRDSQLRVTVFAIGSWITAHPDQGHRVVADGHELGNHTEHHLSMLDLSRDQVRAEIVDGGQALVPFIGSIGRWFRPSGTDVPSQLILEEAGRAGYAVSVG